MERRMEETHSIAGVGPVRAADLQWPGKDTDAIASLRGEHASALEELKAAKEQLELYRDEITAKEDIINKLGVEVIFFVAVSFPFKFLAHSQHVTSRCFDARRRPQLCSPETLVQCVALDAM
jgi:hypothetical protein